MKDTLHYIIKTLINNEDFTILETINEGNVHFTVEMPEQYLGAVIGKGGNVANAIRLLMRTFCKGRQRVNITFEGK